MEKETVVALPRVTQIFRARRGLVANHGENRAEKVQIDLLVTLLVKHGSHGVKLRVPLIANLLAKRGNRGENLRVNQVASRQENHGLVLKISLLVLIQRVQKKALIKDFRAGLKPTNSYA